MKPSSVGRSRRLHRTVFEMCHEDLEPFDKLLHSLGLSRSDAIRQLIGLALRGDVSLVAHLPATKPSRRAPPAGYITVKQASVIAHISTQRLYQLIQQGTSLAMVNGHRWLINLDELQARMDGMDTPRAMEAPR